MCQECMTRGLWAHEETQQLDKFIAGFTNKPRAKKPSYHGRAEEPPVTAPQPTPPAPGGRGGGAQPVERSSEFELLELPSLE
mmetsp:Transcript_28383/g.84030  ORF Transcript_28383/g.84030 Transcript_28383/m.84030 type:complete len:82 (-) Transcript_28383:1316-1561(-)